MDKSDMVTLAKIIEDTVRIHEESYDRIALAEARAVFSKDSIPSIDYNAFYTNDTMQCAHESIKIHIPGLTDP